MCLGEKRLDPALEPSGQRTDVSFRSPGPPDLQHIELLRGPGMVERIGRNKILGSQCLVATRDGEIAAYAWRNTQVFGFLGRELWVLPRNTLCLHDVYVFPTFRGSSVFSHLVAEVFHRGLAENRRAVFCVVDRANEPALGGFRQLGMRFRWAPILKLPGRQPIQFGARTLVEAYN